MRGVEVFLSSSHKDNKLAERVVNALRSLERQGVISISYEADIPPGTNWVGQIGEFINRADIILFLLSPDFLASSRHDQAIDQALMKQKVGEARVIPVLLRPVGLRETPLDELQALPTGSRPISAWSDTDAAYFDVAQGVLRVAAELTKNIPSPQSPIWKTKEEELRFLEHELIRSYDYMYDYVDNYRLSHAPEEKIQTQKSIFNRLQRTQEMLRRYMGLVNEFGVIVPKDIIEGSAYFDNFVTQKT